MEWINCTKKAFENVHRIPVKVVTLMLFVWGTILENVLTIAVIDSSEFVSAEDLKCLTNLAEHKVSVCLILKILLWVVGECKLSVCSSNLLE